MPRLVQQITRYLAEVQRRSNLADFDFDGSRPYVPVPFAEVQSGTLSAAGVAQLYALRDQARSGPNPAQRQAEPSSPPSPPAGAKPLDVVISLVTLEQDGRKAGLLLLPAAVAPDGTLSADLGSGEPWIPVSRLRSRGTADRDVMVGELAALWKWRNGKGHELTSRAETWKDAVALSYSLLDAVADDGFAAAGAGGGVRILRDECLISPGQVITANGAILDLYRYLLADERDAAVFDQLLSSQRGPRTSADGLDDDIDSLRESALRSAGSMSDGFPLTTTQRRAVHAFQRDGRGDVTAVSGPPGTGKTTMLQSVVATLIVQHALDAAPAPLIVGTSTNNQAVTNIIDSFSSVTKNDPGVLDQRWLLDASTPPEQAPRPLKSLATYCPSRSKLQEAQQAGYLVEDTGKAGVYSQYSTREWAQLAEPYFLQQVGDYASRTGAPAPKTLDDAVTTLRVALEMCDAARRDLVTLRARLDHEVGPPSDVLTTRIDALGAELDMCNTRLSSWRDKGAAPGSEQSDEEFTVRIGRRPDEPVFDTIAEYVAYYENRSAELGAGIDDCVRQRDAVVGREQAAADEYRRQAARSAHRGTLLGLGGPEHEEKLLAASTLLELDRVLDTTLRYTEFWLAVHCYEAQWLQTVTGTELIPVKERNRTTLRYMEKYWQQVACLTPCFVMTAYQAPKYFQLWTRDGEAASYDLGRPDLLIVDEAGQVDTSVGAAVFALPKQALVVGDVQQLAPVWSIDPQGDEEMARAFGLGDVWPQLTAAGLTASDHSSIMAAASAASRWCYGPDDDPGLFLAEHFRCHREIIEFCNELLYKGLLKPSRPDAGYRLAGKVPHPFLYCEVEGSRDQRQGSSRINQVEAAAIAEWIGRHFGWLREIYNPAGDSAKDTGIIGVVTPFAAQARLISRELTRVGGKDLAGMVTVGTAHRLQGAERSVVLFSSVYGDTSDQASFIDGTLELMNVAVSRARDLFIVFGGKRRWDDHGPVFSLVRDRARRSPCEFATAEHDAAEHDSSPDAGLPESSDSAGEAATASAEPHDSAPFVSRDEPGWLVASQMLKRWREQGVVGVADGIKPAALNRALEAAGLLTRTQGHLEPTAQGVKIGIALYAGTSGAETYVNPIYSPQAQQALAAMVEGGELSLE